MKEIRKWRKCKMHLVKPQRFWVESCLGHTTQKWIFLASSTKQTNKRTLHRLWNMEEALLCSGAALLHPAHGTMKSRLPGDSFSGHCAFPFFNRRIPTMKSTYVCMFSRLPSMKSALAFSLDHECLTGSGPNNIDCVFYCHQCRVSGERGGGGSRSHKAFNLIFLFFFHE